MDIVNAKVVEVDEKYFIRIDFGDEKVSIPLSEDKPNEVKLAFNKLMERMRLGVFQINLDGGGEDLFNQVAAEYLNQLNREIQEVHVEMCKCGLSKSDALPAP